MTDLNQSYANAELLGGMLQSLWAAFPDSFQDLLKQIAAKHGLDNVAPDQWYPLGKVMESLHETEETFGYHLLRQVGEEAAARAPLSADITSIRACLFALNDTFRKFHRGGNVGGYEVKEDPTASGMTKYLVVASTPYPCSLTSGYLEGYARRFGAESGTEILVRHEDSGSCRRTGGATCTYVVTCWS
jgi:hypothetical protein